jgi:hypothetical protein
VYFINVSVIFKLLRSPGIDSASLCTTRFLAPIDCSKIPALVCGFLLEWTALFDRFLALASHWLKEFSNCTPTAEKNDLGTATQSWI